MGTDLATKFHPVLDSLRHFLVAVFGAVEAGCGAEPFRLRSAHCIVTAVPAAPFARDREDDVRSL